MLEIPRPLRCDQIGRDSAPPQKSPMRLRPWAEPELASPLLSSARALCSTSHFLIVQSQWQISPGRWVSSTIQPQPSLDRCAIFHARICHPRRFQSLSAPLVPRKAAAHSRCSSFQSYPGRFRGAAPETLFRSRPSSSIVRLLLHHPNTLLATLEQSRHRSAQYWRSSLHLEP